MGAIVSWNYPFHNVFNPLLANLFAGNALVVKVFCGVRALPRLRHPFEKVERFRLVSTQLGQGLDTTHVSSRRR